MAIFDLIRRIIAWKSSKKMDKVQVDKDSELSNLTRLGSQEVIERYQNDIYVNFFKNYALKQLGNEESNEFRNVRQKVEHVIRNGNQ